MLYDSAFRQHMSSLESTDFIRINQGLYSTMVLAYRGKGQFCQNCKLSDHNQDECALNKPQSNSTSSAAQTETQEGPLARRTAGPQGAKTTKDSKGGLFCLEQRQLSKSGLQV